MRKTCGTCARSTSVSYRRVESVPRRRVRVVWCPEAKAWMESASSAYGANNGCWRLRQKEKR